MKKGSRILGIDDASFSFEEQTTFLTGVVYRGTEFIEDIKTVPINVDGEKATETIIDLHNNCKNPGQIKAVLLDGISFAGFNVVNLKKASEELEKPVIAVTKNRPDREKFRETMNKTDNYDSNFEKLEEPVKLELEDGKAYIQFKGCDRNQAEKVIKASIIHGQIPEPIRVADMIGSGTKSLRKILKSGVD